MFEEARYLLNSFSIAFPRQPDVRRRANDLEDKLKERLAGHYSQPTVLPLPDDLDPHVPRLIFSSQHGFSQILVSQVNLVFNVTYSAEWQVDEKKREKHLRDRFPIMFELLSALDVVKPHFCGLMTNVHLASREDDSAIVAHVARMFLRNGSLPDTYDIEVRRAIVTEDRFFNVTAVQNYRLWDRELQQLQPLPRKDVKERGVQVVVDFNDRYSFNERESYSTDSALASEIIDRSYKEMQETVSRIEGQ